MLTLFGDLRSGNVHKAQLILHRCGIPYRRVDASQARGEPRTNEFLAINPIGKVPTVLFDNGDVLSESGAILYFFGSATELWPLDLRSQTEVLRWMFFEQYSHEPSLAVMRYLKHYMTGVESESRIRYLEPKAHHALEVMENQLGANEWIAGGTISIADFCLYPYTRVMDESGIDPGNYASVNRWLGQLESQENFLVMGRDGAEETITFSDFVLEARSDRGRT
ncbi:MAG: glutathione S-transferase family protein [Gammaproteobacteria bacterium]|nr:glutathione S-transferase family protein [Gammaproteobacteria bacterium]MDH5275444.1 glutathione S-transferase family protein [Gammaproteobacteria bacterium]